MQLSRELNSSFKNFLETIDHKILYTPKIIPAAHTRLICFSYAGGNSATFLPWLKFLPLDIELVVVQLPGRGCRLFEQPIETMSEVVSLIAGMVASRADKELVFFGHSLGAKVAYEVIRHLDKANFVLPRMFFASGSSSPFARRDLDCIHTLPDAEFISKLRELNGTPEAVLENPEIMELVMPALRADFKIVENYQNHEDSILPVELSLFCGREDTIPKEDILSWMPLFESNLGVSHFDGGHFFIDNSAPEVVEKLSASILA